MFYAVNTVVVIFWILFIAFPGCSFTVRISKQNWIFYFLTLAYIYYLSIVLKNIEEYSLSSFFSSEAGINAGWIHYLILDLYVGRVIFNDSGLNKIKKTITLILTMLFAPIGIVSYHLFKKEGNEI